jgi:4-oxalocrotonate tautomerase
MPHVVVKHWPGPTEEQKAELAARLVQAVRDVFGSSEASLSVALEEVAPAAWTEAVWRPEIEPKLDVLYKKPGYTPS